MPQMYPMSWVMIFLFVQFMLVLSLVLMSNFIFMGELTHYNADEVVVMGMFWEW